MWHSALGYPVGSLDSMSRYHNIKSTSQSHSTWHSFSIKNRDSPHSYSSLSDSSSHQTHILLNGHNFLDLSRWVRNRTSSSLSDELFCVRLDQVQLEVKSYSININISWGYLQGAICTLAVYMYLWEMFSSAWVIGCDRRGMWDE